MRYTFPLDRSIDVDDHWPLEIEGGHLELVPGDEGDIVAIKFEKSGLPTDFSIKMSHTPDQKVKGAISVVDPLFPKIRDQLNNAFAFLRCMFGADIALDRVTIECEAESAEEDDEIPVKSFSSSRAEQNLPLSFDLISRALMAADSHPAPHYEAELISFSRESLSKERFIDAFRYSFLLLEALHGNGKFRTAQLIQEFKSSATLKGAIASVVADWPSAPIKNQNSETYAFALSSPSADEVIEHLVGKRGFYFHGNVKMQGAWKPHDQSEAEALAWLCVSTALKLSFEAADPIFSEEYVSRHFAQAKSVGAIIVITATCKFRVPEDDFIRSLKINVNCPGSKAHTVMLMKTIPVVLERFEKAVPVGRLHSIIARSETGEELLRLRFETEPDGIEIA